jgi:hypothetical protein
MAPAIFFDLDGVLADFVTGALELHGKSIPVDHVRWDFDRQLGIEPAEFWAPMGRSFWAGLPVHCDGFELLRRAERLVPRDRIALLSSPCANDGCVEGKRDWVKRWLPEYLPRLFVGTAKHLFASPSKILVDDHDGNIDRFVNSGGFTVTAPRPWNLCRWQCRNGAFDPVEVTEELRHILSAMR